MIKDTRFVPTKYESVVLELATPNREEIICDFYALSAEALDLNGHVRILTGWAVAGSYAYFASGNSFSHSVEGVSMTVDPQFVMQKKSVPPIDFAAWQEAAGALGITRQDIGSILSTINRATELAFVTLQTKGILPVGSNSADVARFNWNAVDEVDTMTFKNLADLLAQSAAKAEYLSSIVSLNKHFGGEIFNLLLSASQKGQ